MSAALKIKISVVIFRYTISWEMSFGFSYLKKTRNANWRKNVKKSKFLVILNIKIPVNFLYLLRTCLSHFLYIFTFHQNPFLSSRGNWQHYLSLTSICKPHAFPPFAYSIYGHNFFCLICSFLLLKVYTGQKRTSTTKYLLAWCEPLFYAQICETLWHRNLFLFNLQHLSVGSIFIYITYFFQCSMLLKSSGGNATVYHPAVSLSRGVTLALHTSLPTPTDTPI